MYCFVQYGQGGFLMEKKICLPKAFLFAAALFSIILITIWIVGSARNMFQRSLVQFDIGKFC